MSKIFTLSIFRIFIYIFILNILSKVNSESKMIVLPFKTYPKDSDAFSILSNCIYTNINITSQNLMAIFDSSEYEFYMTSEHCPDESNYYIHKSPSFTNLSDRYASERMLLYRDYELKELSYGLFTKMKVNEYNNKKQCAIFGLQMNSKVYEYNSRFNFIKTFKSNENLNSSQWTFKYTSENEGLLLIGDEPINYDPAFKNKKYKLHQTKAVGTSDTVDFGLDFDDVNITNKKLAITHVQFCDDLNAISVNKAIYEEMEKIFFEKYLNEGVCYKRWVYDKYGYIECDSEEFSDEDVNSFPSIFFKKVDMEYIFELNSSDLFYKSTNGNIFFLIVFDLHFSTTKIGKPFLKKYPFTVDNDKNTISLYVLDNENINSKTNNTIIYLAILICVVIILLGLAAFLLYKLYWKKIKNKKRANELDEDYEYLSKEKNRDKGEDNSVESLGI